ncbi:MAG: hypothetical protein PHP48_04905 [Bacteroidales bacterium]|nr:hypothetical protein [Bacteroidales bacterium]
MRKIYWLILLLCPIITQAQQPQWVDYSWRLSTYPEKDFFITFISGEVSEGQDAKNLLDVYEEQAKAALIQQIQVSLQAATDYQLANIDAATTEAFKMRSQSISKAQITGLRTERYHDRKKSLAYAIAWAKKSELKYFYRNAVSRLMEQIKTQKLTADNYRSKNDQQQALKTYYETMPVFTELEEAQFILLALEIVNESDTRLKESHDLLTAVKNAITDLQQSEKASIDDLGYFMAYGLFLQLGDLQSPVILQAFGFENSGLISEFSERFKTALSSGFVRAGDYKVSEYPSSSALVVSGSYWKEGEYLKVNAVARQNGQAKAAAEISLPVQWLRDRSVNWVPENYLRIAKLAEISIEAVNPQHDARAGRPLSEPLKVKVQSATESLTEVPLLFYLQDEIVGKAATNQTGLAVLPFTAKQADRLTQIVLAKLDLKAFIGGEPEPAFLSQLEKQYPIAPARFMIKVAPLTIFVQSSEKGHYGNQLDINLLEPTLKEALAERGYAFTDQMSEADLLVEIDAKARNGSNVQGIYFGFVDASVSVMDLSDGREIWKQSLSSIKGGGADFNRAIIKAYEMAAQELKDAMPDKIK